MNSPASDPVQMLLSIFEQSSGRVLIGLAGFPGSGKSTVATKLASAVNERCGAGTMLALGMDGFHLSKAELRKLPDPEAALARRGAPWTFDPAGMAKHLRALRENTERSGVAWPDFQHDVGDPVEGAHQVPQATRLILVEGLYVLMRDSGWTEVFAQFDAHWFLNVPLEIALGRLANRHMAAWGMTRAQAEERIAQNDALNAELVAATMAHADYLLPDSPLVTEP